MTTEPKKRDWTPEQRAEQGRRLKARKIWLKSTGPRTAQGKRISACNSYKHGAYTFEKQVLRWYVRLAALRLKQLKARRYLEDYKARNELRGGKPRPDYRLLPEHVNIARLKAEHDERIRKKAGRGKKMKQ